MSTHNIKGFEWISLTTLLVWFQGSSTNNKSEITHVDITTGKYYFYPEKYVELWSMYIRLIVKIQ